MTILVTGATGFIGRAITQRLLQEGEKVRVYVRSRARFEAFGMDGVEIVEGDITDADGVMRAARGTDCIYAIAGTFREAGLSKKQYEAINVGGVRNVMEAARRNGTRRVVHCSTVGIHGEVQGPPIDEQAPIRPDSIYERTKAEGEALALEYARSGSPEVVVIRPAPVYGPGDTRLLKMFRMARKNPIPLIGRGSARYHMIHINDLVNVFLRAGRMDGLDGEAVIAAGPEAPSIRQLFSLLAELLGNRSPRFLHLPAALMLPVADLCEKACRPLGIHPPIYRRRLEFFVKNRHYRIERLHRRLGYHPAMSLRDGLLATTEWYRRSGQL